MRTESANVCAGAGLRALSLFRIILLLGFALGAGTVRAGTVYWDPDGAAAGNTILNGVGLGGTGNWDTTASTWWSGTGADAAWVNGNNDTAVFWGPTAGTVTLTAPITVGGLTFNTSGYILDASANALTFGATDNAITLNNVAAAMITGTVAGSGKNVTLTGGAYAGATAGTLTLNGTSAGGWSGATTIGNGMTLTLTNANQALLNTSGITLNSGGKLVLASDLTTTNLNRVSDAAPITVNGGGTISYLATTNAANYSETVGSITMNSGELTLQSSAKGTGQGTETLTVSNLIRDPSSTLWVYFNNSGYNLLKVSAVGASNTPAGQIIGPWIHHWGASSAVNYGAYANGQIVGATLTTTNQDAWVNATTAYKTTGNQTLTADRTAMAIQFLPNLSATVDVANASLKVNGILSAGNSLLTSSGTGYLTTTDHGATQQTYLYVLTPAFVTCTIGLPIIDNNGAVTVVKGGGYSGDSSLVILTNSACTFSGGVVLNAGKLVIAGTTTNWSGGVTINGGTSPGGGGNLAISSDANLGTNGNVTFNGSGTLTASGVSIGSGRTITLTNGAIATITASAVNGPVVGNGGVVVAASCAYTSAANTFTGPVNINNNIAGTFASLSDAASAGVIALGSAGVNASTFTWSGGPQTFANRQFVLNGTTGGGTINNNGTGVLTINTDAAITYTNAKTLTLGGTYAGGPNTFAGRIGDSANGATALTKADAGTWVLSGSNTYSGATTLNAGTLVLGNASALGTGPLTISGASTLDSSVVNLVNNQNNAQNWNANFTFAGSQNLDLGTGAVTLSAARTVTVNANTLTVGGAIGGAFGLTKSGVGTLALSGANTYGGATANNGGGTLVLDYSTQDNSKLSDTNTLTLGNATTLGGTLTLKGGTHVEVVTNTTLSAGGTFLTRASGGTSKLRMNAITRQAGGTIEFADAAIADTDTPNTTGGILGGWATLGNDWAVSANGSAADTAIAALSSYTGTLPTSGGTNTGNYTLTGSQTQSGAVAAHTVKIAGSGIGDTLALGAYNLTNWSVSATQLGGLLYVGGGDNNYTISGSSGRIVPSTANQELIFNVSTGTLAVSALVATNGASSPVTKTGPGTLVLNNTNSYTGATYVNQGVLRLANDTAAGAVNGTIYVQNGAAVELAGGISIGAKPINPMVGSGPSSGGALRNVSGANTYGGAITLGAGGARINADGGLLNLTGNIGTAAGKDLTVGGSGTVAIGSAITGAGGLIKDGAGTLTLTGTNTYSGATAINAGTLAGVTGGSCSNSAVSVTGAGTLQIQVTDNTLPWMCASLALNNGSTVRFTFAVTPGRSVAPLNVLGNLTFSGTPVIQVDPAKLGSGQTTYPLLTAGGTAPSTLPLLQGVSGRLSWGGPGNKTLYLTTNSGMVLIVK